MKNEELQKTMNRIEGLSCLEKNQNNQINKTKANSKESKSKDKTVPRDKQQKSQETDEFIKDVQAKSKVTLCRSYNKTFNPKSFPTINKLNPPKNNTLSENNTLSKNVVNNLADQIMFEDDVLAERCISKYGNNQNFQKLFKGKNSLLNKKVKNKKVEKFYPKRHMPCHLTPIDVEEFHNNKPKKSQSDEAILLGVSMSYEKLKTLPRESLMSLKPLEGNGEDMKSLSPVHTWDEHVIALLSNSTADIILNNFTPNHSHQEKLKKFLNKRENKNEKSSTLDNKSEDLAKESSLASDPSTSKVTTTQSITEDFFTNISGNKKTSEKELENVFQTSYPQPPNLWCKNNQPPNLWCKNNQAEPGSGKWKKGMKKWIDYPHEVKEEELELQKLSNVSFTSDHSIDLTTCKQQQSNNNLLQAVDEWRTKWLLEKRWFDKSLNELMESMADINDHVRLAAVTAASKAILKLRKEAKVGNDNGEKELEDRVLKCISSLLKDTCTYVSLAAAITLYSIDRADNQATEMLMNGVERGAPTERWIAVQCLAEYDKHDDCIIKELISHVNSTDMIKHKKACDLLKHLSYFTTSIQFMLAEQLNSSSWRDRVVACQILPLLHGTLNKDIANKLSYLMWNDWSKDVRRVAAKCLGSTGNGKLVHNALCERLQHLNHMVQIDALKKISHLGIATPQILPSFLKCLNSKHDTLCLEAIKTASVIKVKDEKVIETLCELVSQHDSWKIKAFAVKALGRIGETNVAVRETLLWAVHYEKEVSVRIEACNSISKLSLKDEEIIKVLQDMIIVEDSHDVKSQVAITLYGMGLKPTGDLTMLEAVQANVKQLCRKERVLAHILSDEALEKYNELILAEKDECTADGNKEVPGNEGDAVMHTEYDSNDSFTTKPSNVKGFNPIMEAYHARMEIKEHLELPQMTSSYIPYWTESIESLRDNE